MSIVVCTDLSVKEPHRQLGMGTLVKSDSPGGVMVGTLVWNARDVGSISALGAIFPISPHDTTISHAIL